MANRNQSTSDDFTPVTFTRKGDDGSEQELVATSPADVVRLRFDGWTEKGSASAKSGAKPAAAS